MLRNHILFVPQAEVYLLLKYAISHRNIGLLTHAFARATILFHGSSKTNYQFETNLFWLTATDASSDELKKAILANSLVDMQGKEKKFFAIDLHLELFNGWIKKIIRGRRTSSINIEYLFEYSTRFATAVGEQLAWMNRFYNSRRNTKHVVDDPGPDIISLARELQKGIEFRFTGGPVTRPREYHSEIEVSMKQDADVLPDHREEDHEIELIEGKQALFVRN